MISEPRHEHRQRGHRVRLERGLRGVELLAADCAVVVVVDVLSFCTSVDVALGRGASVLPQRTRDPELLAGCLRNASAVSAALLELDGPIGLVPAGERWMRDGFLSA